MRCKTAIFSLLGLVVSLWACTPKTPHASTERPAIAAIHANPMKERIIRFESEPHHISFSFSKSAGIYKLPITHKDFVAIMTRVAKAYQDDSEVEVVTQGNDLLDIR